MNKRERSDFFSQAQNAMATSSEVIDVSEAEGADRQDRDVGISWFLWRPWYARLWWKLAALFWLTAFGVGWLVPEWSRVMDRDLLMNVGIFFHPFIIAPVLGLRLYWRWFVNDTFAWPRDGQGDDEQELDRLYDGESIGFHRFIEPYSRKPADPLAPSNPSSPYYRRHHRDR